MKEEQQSLTTVGENEGNQLLIAGGNYRIILSGNQTKGEYAVIEMTVPPGAGPNPHAHPDIEETFFVLEGEVSFKSDAGNYVAKTGSMIKIDKSGLVHSFKNLSDKPAKLLCTVFPAGLEDLFQELADFDPSLPLPEKMAAMKALADKYGNKMYPPDYFE